MKNDFNVFYFNYKLIKGDQIKDHLICFNRVNTWKCLTQGAGELRSDNQGRSRVTSFSQETGIKIQNQSRSDGKPNLLNEVQDAQKFLAHLPSFFLFFKIYSN